MAKILIADDEEIMRDLVVDSLSMQGHQCVGCRDVQEALSKFDAFAPDLVVSDYKMPGKTGVDFLREVKSRNAQTGFVLMTAYGTIETAVEAMKLGATDFIEKPFQPEVLEHVVARVLENRSLRQENAQLRSELQSRHKLVGGESKGSQELETLLSEVAASHATVLIMGESGVGKEVLARNLHARSDRAHGPFVKINCAALPENLIEAELFGYEKGSFTGALKTKKGKFEMAHRGTLLLDEIGEMPLSAQAKLLRVLQEREVVRIGGDDEIEVDVRVVCTTNRDLAEEAKAGRFREDLYYRLNVIPVTITPLRERRDDIPLLVHHFIEKFNAEYGYSVEGIAENALSAVKSHDWPGNIRQLENAVERAMVFTKTGLLPLDRFEAKIQSEVQNQGSSLMPGMTIARMEQELILKTLDHCEWNKAQAAEMLDISIRTLRNKLHEYGEFRYERQRGDEDDENAEVHSEAQGA
jgi:DNA-binding NtrC family response regulator